MNENLNLDQLPVDGESGTPISTGSETNSAGPVVSIAPSTSTGHDVHLVDYIKILYKRRHLAIAVFLAVVSTVTVYTFTVTPVFEAKSRLLIEAENPNIVSFKQVIDEQQSKSDYYQTQYNILQSRSLARKTIDSLKLWDHPTVAKAPTSPTGISAVLALPGRLFHALSGQEDAPAPNLIPGADETQAQSRVIDSFLSHLIVEPVRNSRLVDIKYRLPEPGLATQIINSIARNYIEQTMEFKFLATKDATDFLSERLAVERKNLQTAEEALQRYRENNDAIAMEGRENIVSQKLSDLNAAVTRAKTTRIEKEALYNQLRASQNNLAQLDTFPAILSNAFVQQLKAQLADLQRQQAQLGEKLLDQHPDMIKLSSAIQNTQAKLDGEIRKIVQSVKSEYDSALAQEQSLSSALSQQRGEALSMNKKSIEYSVLERDVQSSKQIYESLMQRAKETGVSGELRTSNIRVVDPAERPRRPLYPNKPLNILSAIFGGALLAISLAFTFEYLDSRLKTPEELKVHLGLAHLGLLPLAVPANQEKGEYCRLDEAAPASFAEAFRVLRTNVIFSTVAASGHSILITSTGPGEGKSLVASNLAISLAQAGKRVLLIDADLRKPKAHDVFGVSQEPGLSNVLVGSSKASEAVRKADVSGLWLLPAGRIPPNPAELLSSARFADFLASLKNHFDWVVIDSPPVMAVADASVIAHLTSGVLFVVGTDMTSRHAARRAVEQITTSRGRFLGAVLNRVDLEKNAYYYSQYYRREYTAYYTKT